MKSLGVALALLGIASSGGCASEVGSTTTPEQWIRYAHESIERNRAVQQFVIFAAPLERKVEATLKRDPRITTARFGFEDRNAYYLQGDLVFGEQGGLGYDLVLVANVDLAEREVSTLLESAFSACGLRIHGPLELHHFERQWAVRWGTAWLHPDEPVNVEQLKPHVIDSSKE